MKAFIPKEIKIGTIPVYRNSTSFAKQGTSGSSYAVATKNRLDDDEWYLSQENPREYTVSYLGEQIKTFATLIEARKFIANQF